MYIKQLKHAELPSYNDGFIIFQFCLCRINFVNNTRYCWLVVNTCNIASKQAKYNLGMHGAVVWQET